MGGPRPGRAARHHPSGLVASQRRPRAAAHAAGYLRGSQPSGLPRCRTSLYYRPGEHHRGDELCRRQRLARLPLRPVRRPVRRAVQRGGDSVLWSCRRRRRHTFLPAHQPADRLVPHRRRRRALRQGERDSLALHHHLPGRHDDTGRDRHVAPARQCLDGSPQEALPHQVRRIAPHLQELRHALAGQSQKVDAHQQLRRQDPDAQPRGLRDSTSHGHELRAVEQAGGRHRQRRIPRLLPAHRPADSRQEPRRHHGDDADGHGRRVPDRRLPARAGRIRRAGSIVVQKPGRQPHHHQESRRRRHHD